MVYSKGSRHSPASFLFVATRLVAFVGQAACLSFGSMLTRLARDRQGCLSCGKLDQNQDSVTIEQDSHPVPAQTCCLEAGMARCWITELTICAAIVLTTCAPMALGQTETGEKIYQRTLRGTTWIL